jgi:PII-like signaling protein
MQGIYLKFYVSENQKHGGMVLYEWLLEQAKKMGIHGGSAFRAIAGFGRHGVLHEEAFFELAGDLPVEVGFVVSEAEAAKLLALLEAEQLKLFYVKIPAQFGAT